MWRERGAGPRASADTAAAPLRGTVCTVCRAILSAHKSESSHLWDSASVVLFACQMHV